MENVELPSNAHIKRETLIPAPEKKVVEKVVTGKVVRRKTPLGRKFIETFVGGEAKGVGHYILFEVVIPALKDITADVVSQAIERMLYGEARSTSRRTGARPSGHVNYNRYSSTPAWNRGREESRVVRRKSHGSHDFDDIILNTRVEAEEVISRMFDLVSKYEQVLVSDLYELVGEAGDYTDEKWGWTDLRGAGITRITNGYLLDLPKPEPMD